MSDYLKIQVLFGFVVIDGNHLPVRCNACPSLDCDRSVLCPQKNCLPDENDLGHKNHRAN